MIARLLCFGKYLPTTALKVSSISQTDSNSKMISRMSGRESFQHRRIKDHRKKVAHIHMGDLYSYGPTFQLVKVQICQEEMNYKRDIII